MKKAALLLLTCGIVGTANAESFLAKKPWEQSAIALQKELPAVSCDGLFQAQRKNASMRYSFFTKYDKTWAEEVHISVMQKSTLSSEVKVQAYKVSGGLIFSGLRGFVWVAFTAPGA